MSRFRGERGREIPPTAGLPLFISDFLPPWKGDFASRIEDYLGAAQVGVECSGTAALIVILKTLHRLSGRREVVVPAYTCPLVALAVAHCGLRLRVCDLSPDSLEMAPETLAAACNADTLAIVPTYLGGRAARIDTVRGIADAVGAFVVEDAAQAFGARIDGVAAGLVGDAGCYSFAAGKGLSLFEGGAWTSKDAALGAELARTSREMIPSRHLFEFRRCLELLGLFVFYRPALLRHVYGNPLRHALGRGDTAKAVGDIFSPDIPLHRVSAWRQAVGCHAIARLSAFREALACQARERLPRLSALSKVSVFTDGIGGEGVWPFIMVRLADEAARDAALQALWTSGRGVTRLFAQALPDYAYLRPWVAVQDCPNARHLAACSLTISNSLWLDDGIFDEIVEVLVRVTGSA